MAKPTKSTKSAISKTMAPRQVTRNKTNHQYKIMPKDYSLIKEIREDPLYKSNAQRRDAVARKVIDSQGKAVAPDDMVAGNLYLMKYFYPKTEEQLEYYDAMPCSIIFGKFKTKKGEPRILTFNIHYYPPKMRYQILNRVMEMYQNVYRGDWKSGLGKDLHNIQYAQLLMQLKKAKLDFGVREYIPNLINDCILVPPSLWHMAVFTEGRFKKRTREAIMNYWKQYKP